MLNVYKIGKTIRTSIENKRRYKTRYGEVIEHLFIYTKNHHESEKLIHKLLTKYRKGNSELFKGKVKLFKLICKFVCKIYNNNLIFNDQNKHYDNIIKLINGDDLIKLKDKLNETLKGLERHYVKTMMNKRVMNKHFLLRRSSHAKRELFAILTDSFESGGNSEGMDGNSRSDVNKRIYICEKCRKQFKRYDNYKRHISRKTPCNVSLNCPYCDKKFKYKSRLKDHYKPRSRCYVKKLELDKIKLELDKIKLELELKDEKQKNQIQNTTNIQNNTNNIDITNNTTNNINQ